MSDSVFEDHQILKDISRLMELDEIAYSGRGITLDDNIERKDLQNKFKDQSIIKLLLEIAERSLNL